MMFATSWAVRVAGAAIVGKAVGVAVLAGEDGIESRRAPSCCKGEGGMLL